MTYEKIFKHLLLSSTSVRAIQAGLRGYRAEGFRKVRSIQVAPGEPRVIYEGE